MLPAPEMGLRPRVTAAEIDAMPESQFGGREADNANDTEGYRPICFLVISPTYCDAELTAVGKSAPFLAGVGTLAWSAATELER